MRAFIGADRQGPRDLGQHVVGIATGAAQALGYDASAIDLAIVDLNLSDGPTGLEIAASLAKAGAMSGGGMADAFGSYSGKGTADALYSALMARVRDEGLSHLTVTASHLARRFFARHGWTLDRKEDLAADGQIYEVFRMSLDLTPTEARDG